MIAKTPNPPYYAVIFSTINEVELEGYDEMATRMDELASQQEGYLGMESARQGLGITVSYWKSLEAIKAWKDHLEHKIAQEKGIKSWYSHYKTRIALVERDYEFEK